MVFAIFWSEMIQKRNDELSRIAERRQGLNVFFLLSVWWVLALSWLVCAALERKVCAIGSIGLVEVGLMRLSRQGSKKQISAISCMSCEGMAVSLMDF